MREYILSAVLGLGLVACGGGGDSDTDIIMPSVSVVEISKSGNLNGHLTILDYILSDGTPLEKSGVKMDLTESKNLYLFDGDEIIATGYLGEDMGSTNYFVFFTFLKDLPTSFLAENLAKDLRGGVVGDTRYDGYADYDPESRTLKMTIKNSGEKIQPGGFSPQRWWK